jgi:hypothetical protein
MNKLKESDIKGALSALDKKLQADIKLQKTRISQRQVHLLEGKKFLKAYLKKTGFDLGAYEKIRTRRGVQLRRLLKEVQAAGVKRSATVQKSLTHGMEGWRQNINGFVDGTLGSKFVPGYEVVTTPFIIWPTHGLQLVNSHIEPWNNTANILGEWKDLSGNENLRFIFVWQNPRDAWTIINAGTYLQLNGQCDEFEQGGFLSGSVSDLTVMALLNVWEWWNQPPTSPYSQPTQSQIVVSFGADGGGFLSDLGGGNVVSRDVNGNYDLSRSLFLLPPNGVAVFEVMLQFTYENYDGGMVQVIFEGGNYQVMCPAIVIAILS